jgi:hypothetical protein
MRTSQELRVTAKLRPGTPRVRYILFDAGAGVLFSLGALIFRDRPLDRFGGLAS